MKKLMIAAMCGLFVASTAMGNWILNPSFDDEGDGGGSWSAAFWGDGSTDPESTYHSSGRSDFANWRNDDFDPDRAWTMNLAEWTDNPDESNQSYVWQRHEIGPSLNNLPVVFSADFHLADNVEGGATEAELGWFDSEGDWIDEAEVFIDLSDMWDTRDTWHTLSWSGNAPANAEGFQVTLKTSTWIDGAGDGIMSVDNVSVIPEPGTMALMGLGLFGLLGLRRRMK